MIPRNVAVERLVIGAERIGVPHHLTFAELVRRPPWVRDAACRGRTDLNWYPARNASITKQLHVCEDCPVREDCRAAGVDEQYGLWGGQNPRQRAAVRASREHAA